MSKRERIRELEARLRISKNELFSLGRKNGYHARYNSKIKNHVTIIDELESISIKWKIKKILRRILKWKKKQSS